jgi:hypothetical protein
MRNKKIVIPALFILLLTIAGLLLFNANKLPGWTNPFVLAIPAENAVDVAEMVIAPIILFCVGVFLIFIFSGIGLVILSTLVLTGVILLLVAFPFLLPLLIPVFIIWLTIAIVRRRKTAIST